MRNTLSPNDQLQQITRAVQEQRLLSNQQMETLFHLLEVEDNQLASGVSLETLAAFVKEFTQQIKILKSQYDRYLLINSVSLSILVRVTILVIGAALCYGMIIDDRNLDQKRSIPSRKIISGIIIFVLAIGFLGYKTMSSYRLLNQYVEINEILLHETIPQLDLTVLANRPVLNNITNIFKRVNSISIRPPGWDLCAIIDKMCSPTPPPEQSRGRLRELRQPLLPHPVPQDIIPNAPAPILPTIVVDDNLVRSPRRVTSPSITVSPALFGANSEGEEKKQEVLVSRIEQLLLQGQLQLTEEQEKEYRAQLAAHQSIESPMREQYLENLLREIENVVALPPPAPQSP